MRRWLTPLAALLLAVPALAQDGADDKAAKEAKDAKDEAAKAVSLMRSAADALSKATTITFKAEATGSGAQGLRSPDVRCTVQAARADKKDPLGWRFRVEGRARTPGEAERPLLCAYDGKLVRSQREGKKLLEASPDNATETLDDGTTAAAGWLLRWNELVQTPFGSDEEGHPPCRVDGKAEAGGVPCDVVRVDYSDSADPNLFDIWWYLAESDHLPRRLDMHLMGNAAGDGFIVVRISDLKLDAPVPESAVALVVPEGYQIVKAKEPEHKPGLGRAVKVSTLSVGEKAPDWELKDPSGKTHKLSDYAGKVVVMDFWATWCGPCQMAMPGVQAVHEKFKGKPVAVFGLNCWESGDPDAMMKEKGFTYGLLLKADATAKDYGVAGIPTFYVIGKDGKIAHAAVGFNPDGESQLEEVIKTELAKPTPPSPAPKN